ncbi:MAG: endolytic transglycosylase MltG [Collinsella sp.]|nr:endolytic transglycosylase MltG [Collinsella sp.]
MSSASDPRQPNRTRQPASRPVPSGQRPVQLTPRAAQPVARPAQPSSRPAQRPGQQPASRPAQQSAARAAQSAGGARFKQQAPTQRAQAPQSHAHHAHGTHGVAPAARSSYNTHARRGAQKKSSPVPMIIGTVVVVVVLAVVTVFAIPAVKGLLGGEDASVTAGQQVTVTIPDGASGDTIASILSENHIVENPKDYYAAVKKLNADMSLQPGTYSFTTLMDATKVVQQLIEGPNAGSDALTIPEGLTVDQVAGRVAQAYDSISKEDFLNQAKASNYVNDYPFLKGTTNGSLEGFLFPKTYSLGKKPSADDVIRAMLDQFNTEYKSLDFAGCEAKIKERYGVGMSDYDIINLASIVEREGLNAEQRAHVASVFYNRLAGKLDGLRYLNSDATMMYVTGGEVTAADLQSDSPYNTYKHEGLPPTPICSPSLEALKATLEPTDSDDLYFYITQDEEYFSQTYEEHQQSWN